MYIDAGMPLGVISSDGPGRLVSGRYPIDVSELPEGIYLVKWIKNDRRKVEKIIIK